MISLVHVVWWAVFFVGALAADKKFPCRDLVLQLQTQIKGARNQNTRCYLSFNYLEMHGNLSPDGGMQIWEGFVDAMELSLEKRICGQQITVAERVARQAGLSDATLTLYYLFHVGHGNCSAFLKANADVFVVRDNRTLRYCDMTVRHDTKLVALLNCTGCEPLLPTPAEATQLRQKWLSFCLPKDTTLPSPFTTRRLSFTCRDKPVTTPRPTTTRPTYGTTTEERTRRKSEETTVRETTRPSETRTPESVTEITGAFRGASTAVAPVVGTLVAFSVVALALFLLRARLFETWRRWRGTSAVCYPITE